LVKFNKDTVRRAMKSEDAERLMFLASDHVALMKDITINFEGGGLSLQRFAVTDESKWIYEEKVNQITEERDAILKKYE
jgi:hypothetical protein